MQPNNPSQSQNTIDQLTQEKPSESITIEIPQISLPKGGGALKGIDEQFQVNPANGTASFNIPLPITPGRNSFSPALSLSYNSGAGNSPFGLGWSLGYPMIQVKTDRKLPQYNEGPQEDTYTFSGQEDLVPYLDEGGNKWIERKPEVDGFIIKEYRPRIEGAFSRIEQISGGPSGIYWKITSRDNVVSLYGIDETSRISDPIDEKKVYAWLPSFSYDNKGNCIQYIYKPEDLENIEAVLHEQNRLEGKTPFTNKYLKAVKYGNRKPYFAKDPYTWELPPENFEYFFELVFDYGEHDADIPKIEEDIAWASRPDAFSNYRPGFELRTYRLCKRVLMFHHFEELGNSPCLVRSLDLSYEASSINDSGQTEVSYLKEVTQKGYIRRKDLIGSYSSKALPPMSFNYQKLNWDTSIQTVSPDQLANAPVGLTNGYQWVDLYGEGIPGILSEQANGLYYKESLGNLGPNHQASFTKGKQVSPKPSFAGLNQGVLSIQDLEANGQKQIVVKQGEVQGYFEVKDQKDFHPFKAFEKKLNIDPNDPHTRMIDLDGDGRPEMLMTEENVFLWYASEGKKGYKKAQRIQKTFDEDRGPAMVFADKDRREAVLLADMSGDGLTDILRVRNNEICYWPNKGYGRFGAKINMSNAPQFDFPDLFDPQKIQLADISGTGATDIIYLGKQSFKAYINLSGNSWSEAHEIKPFLPLHANTQISVIDLLGTGTSCIVWSSDMPADSQKSMQYIDLMGSKKPHVMIQYANNMGKETHLEYKSSTYFFLKDKAAGKPWITKLPFPVQVISKMTVEEHITQVRFATEYSYHHGYYDYAEREFRGFGRVEQIDTEFYEEWTSNSSKTKLEQSEELYQAPVLTKSWFHTGAFLDRENILNQYKQEYWQEVYKETFPNDPLAEDIERAMELEDARVVVGQHILNKNLISHLTADEWREALRACKGMMLRQEVFALDGTKEEKDTMLRQYKPFTVATHNCHIQFLQPRFSNQYAVFMPTESEAITFFYERDEKDPRIAHNINLKIDELGQILEAASIVYPRVQVDLDLPPEISKKQAQTHIVYTQNRYTNDLVETGVFRLRQSAEAKSYELKGILPSERKYQLEDFQEVLENYDPNNHATGTIEIPYHEGIDPDQSIPNDARQRRLIEHVKTLYYNEELSSALPFSKIASHGISYESYQLAYTPELLQNIFKAKITDPISIMEEGKFTFMEDNWWVRSGTIQFELQNESNPLEGIQSRFFSPLSYTDPFGSITKVSYYKDYFLMADSTIDAMENQVKVEAFNFRSLSPIRMRDINANISEVLLDELGLVKAFALMGKGDEADDLQGLTDISDKEEREIIQQYFTLQDTSQLRTLARQLLQHATARFVYDFDRYKLSVSLKEEQVNPAPCEMVKYLPTVVGSITREQHHAINPDSPLQLGFEYSDGMGNVAMTKVQAEPGEALKLNIPPDCSYSVENVDTGENLRWLGNGRTVLNNKGNPVKQFEPYFSINPFYEDAKELVERGQSPIIYYDALGRNILTKLPDGTHTKVEFDSWMQRSYDQNDTVMDSEWYMERGKPGPDDSSFFSPSTPAETLAAWKAAQCHETPSTIYFDTLGRPIFQLEHNEIPQFNSSGKFIGRKTEKYGTRIKLDIEGNTLAVIDARENTVMAYKYNMLGHRVYQNSMDAGEKYMLLNVAGNPLRSWDSKGHMTSTTYDQIQRPTQVFLHRESDPSIYLIDHNIYGEGLPNDQAHNLRGQLYENFGSCGRTVFPSFDFNGNSLEVQRQLAAAYEADIIDWSPDSITNELEPELFTKITEYDALNRMIKLYNWHKSMDRVAVYEPHYNERQLLLAENHTTAAQIRETDHTGGRKVQAVFDIQYNEKGQRTKMRMGNGTTTRYHYDLKSYRLIQLRTTRNTIDRKLPTPPSNLKEDHVLQNLYYTYDAAGNITEIEDDAFMPVFFKNEKTKPKSRYTYDALYRITRVEGRENKSFDSAPYCEEPAALPVQFPQTDQTLRNYTQIYKYDEVGNIIKMRHVSPIEKDRWTRNYKYALTSNKLSRTWIGKNEAGAITYSHDAHGNMMNFKLFAGDPRIHWNYRDMVFKINLDGGGDAFYQYDNDKIRSRKLVKKLGNIIEERIYLGGMEWYRRWRGTFLEEEIETHHLFVQDFRLLIVEDIILTNNNFLSTGILNRFQHNNHLGSTNIETDNRSEIITYEEYHPFGSLSFKSSNRTIAIPAKRYRFTGMERDNESGLNYHSARYYLVWLGRWLNPDSLRIKGGLNLYQYSNNNPINFKDSSGYQAEQMWFWESSVYTTEVTATTSTRGISQLLRQAMRGAYRVWTGDFHTQIDVGHVSQPQWSLRAGQSATVAPEIASANRSQGASIERAAAKQARSQGRFARVDGIDTTPSGQAAKGTRYPQQWRSNPALTDPIVARAGSAPRAASPSPATPSQAPPAGPSNPSATVSRVSNTAPEQLSLDFGEPKAKPAPRTPTSTSTSPPSPSTGTSSPLKTATRVAGRALQGGLLVYAGYTSGEQIGTGIAQVRDGQTGEGTVTITEGSVNLTLTVASTGVLEAGGGLAATASTSVAAGGAVALAAEETRRALRSEKTMAQEAVEFWEETQEEITHEKASFSADARYVGAEIMKQTARFVASGQENFWGLF